VRAFDCVSKDAFVDARVTVNVLAPCDPEWTGHSSEISASIESSKLFDSLRVKSCESSSADDSVIYQPDAKCQVESVSAKVSLELDAALKSVCAAQEKCDTTVDVVPAKSAEDGSVINLYSGDAKHKENNLNKNVNVNEDAAAEDDDDIEDDSDDDDENKITAEKAVAGRKSTRGLVAVGEPPASYGSFSKTAENAQKIDFDGAFGDRFTLTAWIRRPSTADQTIKEQVLCGSDAKSMNRHHYGLYFYRGNVKFLLRKEADAAAATEDENSVSSESSTDKFYPSLWEWSLYEPVLSDAKWHHYEIRFSYPNASLFIDGVHFAENKTNSDIIDAYKLNDAADTGDMVSYVGACYHG
jgi:hypothetical protein